MVVGKAPDDDKIDRPVQGVRIYGQVGDVVLAAEQDTQVEKSAKVWFPEPVRLTQSEVGPKAPAAVPVR